MPPNLGTRIYVDNELVGTIPPVFLVDLPSGPHEIRYEMPDYATFAETVEVVGGQRYEFSHRFPQYGALRISCDPYAKVRLDGNDVGSTPVNIEKVSEGEHKLTLYRECYQTIEETITVRANEINRLQFTLTQLKE